VSIIVNISGFLCCCLLGSHRSDEVDSFIFLLARNSTYSYRKKESKMSTVNTHTVNACRDIGLQSNADKYENYINQ